jgi:hypothetical protein
MTALKGARADLAAKITTALASYPTVTVLSYEPPVITGDTVTVATYGIKPTDWLLVVRVYVPAIQSSEGQDREDDIVETIDTYPGLQPVGRGEWRREYDDAKDAFVMTAFIDYPRGDF